MAKKLKPIKVINQYEGDKFSSYRLEGEPGHKVMIEIGNTSKIRTLSRKAGQLRFETKEKGDITFTYVETITRKIE